jgi:hypothetical protein
MVVQLVPNKSPAEVVLEVHPLASAMIYLFTYYTTQTFRCIIPMMHNKHRKESFCDGLVQHMTPRKDPHVGHNKHPKESLCYVLVHHLKFQWIFICCTSGTPLAQRKVSIHALSCMPKVHHC